MNDDQNNVAPEKVIINGVEYDPSDAQSLIDLGSKTRDFEKQYNTDISRIMPDYTRATQEAKEYREKVNEFENKAKQAETPAEQAQVLEQARKYGLVDQDSLKKDYVSRSELDSYWNTKTQEQRDTQTILETGEKLGREIDGADGRSKYLPKAVLAYASNYGFFKQGVPYEQSLRNAYEDMTQDVNASWKESQINAAKKPGLTTLKTQGLKTAPEEKKITNEDQFKEALNEALWGQEE